jgi:hypothetical protein
VRGGYRRIGLRYTLSCPYETSVSFLAKLDAAVPPLMIENLHVHGVLRRPCTPGGLGARCQARRDRLPQQRQERRRKAVIKSLSIPNPTLTK